MDGFVTDGSDPLLFVGRSCKFVRVVVGPRIVDVLHTLGCDVINHGGLGRVVVAEVCAAIETRRNVNNMMVKQFLFITHLKHTGNELRDIYEFRDKDHQTYSYWLVHCNFAYEHICKI